MITEMMHKLGGITSKAKQNAGDMRLFPRRKTKGNTLAKCFEWRPFSHISGQSAPQVQLDFVLLFLLKDCSQSPASLEIQVLQATAVLRVESHLYDLALRENSALGSASLSQMLCSKASECSLTTSFFSFLS